MMDRMVILLGDIHGDMRAVMRKVRQMDLRDVVIVQAGDFGFSIDADGLQSEKKYRKTLELYNKSFELRGITFYAIRGNHDDPSYFDGRFTMSNLVLLPDYSVLELNGQRWLLVGGAVSIDRLPRQLEIAKGGGAWWFSGEGFALDKEKIAAAGKVDVVVTHTAPDGACGYELVGRNDMLQTFIKDGDHTLLADIAREQAAMQKMWQLLRFQGSELRNWYHGHFHKAVGNTFQGTRFRCLAVDEMLEHRI